MRSITGFAVHRGVLASFDRKPLPAAGELVRAARRVVVLEDVNNHTNVGAIVRSASALGIDALLLDPGRCDPLYRRSLRISMGEALSLPHARTEALPGGPRTAARGGLRPGGAHPAPGCRRHRNRRRSAATSGSHCCSAPRAPASRRRCWREADVQVRIPLAAGVDSLNVAAAAAIAFYALAPLDDRRLTLDVHARHRGTSQRRRRGHVAGVPTRWRSTTRSSGLDARLAVH